MKNRRWGRRFLVAGIWAMAMSTWGSIGHHLFGLPDFGPFLVVTSVAAVLSWPPIRPHETSPRSAMPAEQGRPSRA